MPIIADGVTDEMRMITQSKFDSWDKIVSDNVLETGTNEEKRKVYLMLRDPTIYAYAFFKNPNNPLEPFKFYPYQDMILNDNHDRVYFDAANQIGKSVALCIKAITYALKHPGATILMTSKTLPQSKDLLRAIKSILINSTIDFKYDVGDTESKTEIYFKHFEDEEVYDEKLDKTFFQTKELPQSRIICVPATESALGYAVNLALVDELPFYENGEYFYKQILQPRTYATKGQIIVFGNPNGQQGIGWELYNDSRFHCYRFNFLDCPNNTQVEFDEYCKGLTREEIDSTLLAIFTSPEGGFFSIQERKKMQEDRPSMLPSIATTPLYIFFDWGKTHDRTVRAIGVPIRNEGDKEWADEVFIHELKEYPHGTPYTEVVDVDLKNLIMSYGIRNIAMVGWDNTGVGSGIEDFIKRVEQLGIPANPVGFDLENKSRIYTLFKLLVEHIPNSRIKIPYIKECDKQLSMLRFKKSPRGYLQVHHENERDRDDYPDAIAGLCSLIIQPENLPISVTIV